MSPPVLTYQGATPNSNGCSHTHLEVEALEGARGALRYFNITLLRTCDSESTEEHDQRWYHSRRHGRNARVRQN